MRYKGEVFERDLKLGCSEVYECMTNEPLGSSLEIEFKDHDKLLMFNSLMIGYSKMQFVCHIDDNYSISKSYVLTVPGEANSMLKFQEIKSNVILVKRVNPAVIIRGLSEYNIILNEYNNDLLKFRKYKSYKNRLKEMEIDNKEDVE